MAAAKAKLSDYGRARLEQTRETLAPTVQTINGKDYEGADVAKILRSIGHEPTGDLAADYGMSLGVVWSHARGLLDIVGQLTGE